MTTSSKLETNRSTKKMPLSTTEHQTHISTELKFTKNNHSSTEYPSLSSILQSTISKFLIKDIKLCFYKHGSKNEISKFYSRNEICKTKSGTMGNLRSCSFYDEYIVTIDLYEPYSYTHQKVKVPLQY